MGCSFKVECGDAKRSNIKMILLACVVEVRSKEIRAELVLRCYDASARVSD